MGRRHRDDATVGEDAFLDTTANLVGILIILVVIIGTKTKIDAEAYGQQLAEQQIAPETQEELGRATAMQSALVKQKVETQQYAMETEYRRLERNKLLSVVVQARDAVSEKMSSSDEEDRRVVEQQRALERVEDELSKVEQQMGAAEAHERPKVVLEHLPTPMARTVFNREMHVQLKAGEVTVIPWDRLVDLLKEQVPLAARRNASRSEMEETLGPIGGFLMQYRMAAIPGGFELDRFELETVADAPTETLQRSLGPSGRLRLELASRDPVQTVVTVWVYPDSFEAFRELKMALFEDGFLCAARPLPEGVRIGASPRGTRSSAQ